MMDQQRTTTALEETEARNIQAVRTYFDGCNSGDIALLMSTLAPEVIHYFLPSSHPPITGAEALAQYWRWWKENLDPLWAVDHVIARGDEVVSEWSVMRDSRIVEVRAYFMASSKHSIQLPTFPYGDRGYLPAPA
jgi:ketosteroid isomerase-like protein